MRLDGEGWRRFFDTYAHEAFRLETMPSYGVASEVDELRQFLTTGHLVIPEDDPWLVRVREFRASGRWVGRVHLVRRPLTEYLRYEFAVYAHSTRAGEDVRIVDITDLPPAGLPQQDFWLFDDSRVVRMDYDADGRQLGREWLEDVDPGPYVAWKVWALELAVPFADYRAKLVG